MLRNPCRVCQVPVETLFCSNSNTDGFIITMFRVAKWSWFLTWSSWDLLEWKSCKSRLFNTHYHGLGYNCIHLILLSKSTDIAILAVQVFKISCSDLKRWSITKFPNLVKKMSFDISYQMRQLASSLPFPY
jgi:hypothetical protein